MAHRWRPSSTLTWKRLRRSHRLGAVLQRWRCCSTEAGSVSPCTTIRRRRSARYSPGTSCQAGSPIWSPKAIIRSASCGARKIPQRYSGIFTKSKLAHPSWSVEMAVRR